MNTTAHVGPPSRSWIVGCALTLSVMTFSGYRNSLTGDFVFDDYAEIVENSLIQNGSILDHFRRGHRRPLVTLSFAANYACGGLDPYGYHLVNLVIHSAASLFLFGLIRQTLLNLKKSSLSREHLATGIALVSAGIWAIHPLQTQAVTYIVQRHESLMGMFYLAMLYCAARANGPTNRRWIWNVGVILCFWLGMGCKEVMVTAPFVLLLYQYSFGEWSSIKRSWVVYLGCLLPLALLGLNLARTIHKTSNAGFGLPGVTPLEYAASQFGVIVHYLKLSFWPDVLVLDYFWPVASRWQDVVVPASILLPTVATGLWCLRRNPPIGFLMATFFIILAPTSSFMPIRDLAFEHRMYLPLAIVVSGTVLVGFQLLCLIAKLLKASDEHLLQVGTVGVLGVVVALTMRTVRRNEDYITAQRMWASTVNSRPDNPRAWYNLGVSLEQGGMKDSATRVFQSSAAVWRERIIERPLDPESHLSLATILERLGDLEAAEVEYRQVLSLGVAYPSNAEGALAHILQLQGKFEEAYDLFQSSIRSRPNNHDVRVNYAQLLTKMKRKPEAVRQLRIVLDAVPVHYEANCNLGTILVELNRHAEAVPHFVRAIEIADKEPQIFCNYAIALLGVGKVAEARKSLEIALNIDPRHAGSLHELAVVEAKHGDRAKAIEYARRAIGVNPSQFPAAYHLGQLLYHEGRYSESSSWLRRAVSLGATHPHKDLAHLFLALSLRELGDWRGTLHHLREANRRNARNRQVALELAQVLATCPQQSLRDGHRAVALASQVHEEQPSARSLQVLAMSEAEAGNPARALVLVGKAIESAREAGYPNLEKQLREQEHALRAMPVLDNRMP